MTTIPLSLESLPSEILSQIIAYVSYHHSGYIRRPSALLPLCLTNKHLFSITIRELFHTIPLSFTVSSLLYAGLRFDKLESILREGDERENYFRYFLITIHRPLSKKETQTLSRWMSRPSVHHISLSILGSSSILRDHLTGLSTLFILTNISSFSYYHPDVRVWEIEHFAFFIHLLPRLNHLLHLRLNGRFTFRGVELDMKNTPKYFLRSIAFRASVTVESSNAFLWILGHSVQSQSLRSIEFPHQAGSFPSFEEISFVLPVVEEICINLTTFRTFDSHLSQKNSTSTFPLTSIKLVITNSEDYTWFIRTLPHLPFPKLCTIVFLAHGPFGNPTDFLKLVKSKNRPRYLKTLKVVKYTGSRRTIPIDIDQVQKTFEENDMQLIWEWEDIFLERDV